MMTGRDEHTQACFDRLKGVMMNNYLTNGGFFVEEEILCVIY